MPTPIKEICGIKLNFQSIFYRCRIVLLRKSPFWVTVKYRLSDSVRTIAELRKTCNSITETGKQQVVARGCEDKWISR